MTDLGPDDAEIADHRIQAILDGRALTPPAARPPRRGIVRRVFNGTLPGRGWGGSRWGPYALVGLAVAYGLYALRSERLPVAYPNDASVHSLTVAFATKQIAAGHFPLDGWFPFLSLGSPFFLHYQSFSAVLTGLLGQIIGAAQAFSWTGYLLLALWPISVYLGARLFDLDRWTAASAAAIAPIISNGGTGYGFEHEAYIFYGSGLWSQLWGMVLLPIALGLAWRAVSRRQQVLLAGFALGWVIIFHFLTAYLAGLAVVVFVLLRPTQILRRIGRAIIVGGFALLIACWVLIPLISTANWAATNEFEEHTFFDDSYGAKQVLSWLVHGQIFDGSHFPIVTGLAAVGFATCLLRWRRDERGRALVGVFLLSLLLYFGRVTFGKLVNILPDSSDLLFHRYVMGVQLFGVIFAGIGVVAIFGALLAALRMIPDVHAQIARPLPMRVIVIPLVVIGVLIAVLQPAWRATLSYDAFSGQSVMNQRASDATDGADVDALIARAQTEGGGRIFAGLASDSWAFNFRVGSVPMYIYLTDRGVDAVGFSLRTSSLVTDPEAYFNEYVPGDYTLFGIHYLIYPAGRAPSVPASLLETRGAYDLYAVNSFGYVHIFDTSGSITANSTNLGAMTKTYLEDGLADQGVYDTIGFNGQPAAPPTAVAGAVPSGSPGTVIAETDNLDQGEVATTVRMNRTAVVTLSASFDPGWRVTVDGLPATPEMVVPAIVGVTVGPGIHTITYRYQSYSLYPELIAVAVLAAIGGAFYERRRRRRASSDTPGELVSDEPTTDPVDSTRLMDAPGGGAP